MARGEFSPDGNMHILYGTGTNCTCFDCVVLYGGECDTTKDNDFLDEIEEKVLKFLTVTPTGREKKVSDAAMDEVLDTVVRPMVQKYCKVQRKTFYQVFYGFMPLLYLMTSDKKEARRWYRRSRIWLFSELVERLKEKKT